MKKLSIVALALPFALIACSSSEPDESSTQVGEEIAAQKPIGDSAYSDIHSEKTCKVTEQSDEFDAVTEECTGAGPYRLRVFSGDLRERATVLAIEGAEFDIDPFSIVPEGAAWNTVGPKAEWRSVRGNGANPYALILRHTFEMPDLDDPAKIGRQHYLTVTKIVGGNLCLYGIVEASKASATANQTARDLADEARGAERCPTKVAITTK